MRINKFLSSSGVASRRKSDEYIKSGRVSVNDKIVRDFIDIDVENDIVKVDDNIIKPVKRKLYFAFNKPPFVLSATKDKSERQTVCDFFRDINERLFCVGRLDYLSEGLILVTNDGDFANRLTHPKFRIKKQYLIKTADIVDDELIDKMKRGVKLEDGFFSPIFVARTKNELWIKMVIDVGRNRIIRRFLSHFNIHIDNLKRIAIGGLRLDNLGEGQYRELSQEEKEYFSRGNPI